MLSVEGESPASSPGVPMEIETFHSHINDQEINDRQINDRQINDLQINDRQSNDSAVNDGPAEPAGVLPSPQRHDDTHDLQSRIEAKVQEAKFYISQQIWDSAKKAVLDLAELAPDAPEINELMAAVSAGQSRPVANPQATEPFAASTFEPAPLDYLPPPFSVPVPQVSIPVTHHEPEPTAASEPLAPAAPQHADTLSNIEEIAPLVPADSSRITPPRITPRTHSVQPPVHAAGISSTEDILGDFILDLEQNDLADFSPQPKAEPKPEKPAPMAASASMTPVQATKSAGGNASVNQMHTNGGSTGTETSSALSDILADLQDENTDVAEEQEDPETHYNLGIAFKEMGLLDEAIGELQKVCRAIDKGHPFSQPIQVYTWLAQCLVDKNAPEAAVRWYMKALQLPGLDDGNRCAIYYDLGVAYEASGDKKSALANYMEVYGSNIDFAMWLLASRR